MNRLEDKFKDAFDHFEPEVDPGVWTKISAQLPSAPSSVTGGSSAVKGLAAKLGLKGIAAIVAAAAITVSAVYYMATRDESPVAPTAIFSEQAASEEAQLPAEEVDNQVENTVSEQKISPVSGSNIAPEVVEENNTNPGHTEDRMVHPTASTGTTVPATGDAVSTQHSPQPVASAPKSTNNESVASNNSMPSQVVPVNTNPSPVLILSSSTGFAPFTFTVLTNQQGKKADFDFGDGVTVDNQISASHTYDKPGDYTLQCLVDGITLTRTIHVSGSVPTAFSPNGDGINDVFEIENTDDVQLEVRIFTRSGRQVFISKGTKIAWDGRLPEGSLAEPGTYLYDIFATSGDGSSWKQKGSLHLFK